MSEVIVRPYEPRDRSAVRKICCDTAARGEAVEHFFQDREAAADLLASYYTDYEPQAVWIAEHEGRVIGYLTGCLDTHRYWRMVLWRVGPGAVLRTIDRGALLSRQTWRFLKAMMKTWFLSGARRPISLDNYPSHLHVNVQEGFRGQHVGRRLVERFCEQVQAAGLKGVYAPAGEDNLQARGLFEGMGFTVVNRRRMVLPEEGADQISYAVIYGKRL